MTDLSEARALADAGITAALEHAESIEPQWQATAYLFLCKYARENRTFIAEEVVAAAIQWGLNVPVPKAFGAVFQRAARNKMIANVGFAPSPNRHGSPTVKWHSLVYRGRES